MPSDSRTLDATEPGFFNLRLVKGGPFVGAEIRHEPSRDPDTGGDGYGDGYPPAGGVSHPASSGFNPNAPRLMRQDLIFLTMVLS